jgi:hypothetical protein
MDDDNRTVCLRCDVPGLVEKVIELVRSETDADKRRLLDENPDLLSEAADDVLRQIEEAHRSLGTERDANSVDGLRLRLKRTKRYGFDHACLEQVVLRSFINMPLDNAGGYLRQVTAQYPELLRLEADDAIAALKRDLYNDDESHVMRVFLDELLKRVREQRSRNNALAGGNRASAFDFLRRQSPRRP